MNKITRLTESTQAGNNSWLRLCSPAANKSTRATAYPRKDTHRGMAEVRSPGCHRERGHRRHPHGVHGDDCLRRAAAERPASAFTFGPASIANMLVAVTPPLKQHGQKEQPAAQEHG